MKLVHPELSSMIIFDENVVNELIIENERFFYYTVNDIYSQINRLSGDYVLSERDEPIDFSKHAELITQFIPFEMNKKPLLTKLYSNMKETSVLSEHYLNTSQIMQEICRYLNGITDETDCNVTFDNAFDISGLFKAVNLRFSDEYEALSEKIIDYMLNVRQFEGEKLYVLVNYRNYVSKSEAEAFVKTVIGHKLKLLLIEGGERERLLCTNRIIIDNELCEIY